MAFIQHLGQLRSPVSTYANLPLSGNTLGDIRITLDIGVAYSWTNNNGIGTWTDWKKLTVSNYADLQGRPSSNPLDIDNAIKSVRNIYLNLVLAFFKNSILYASNVLKMFEGALDNFYTTDGIDEDKSIKAIHSEATGFPYEMTSYDYFYLPNFSNIDEYTKIYFNGPMWDGQINQYGGFYFYDYFQNLVSATRGGITLDAVNTKFGNDSFHFTDGWLSFENPGGPPPPAVFGNPCRVNGLDFTWDYWIRPDSDNSAMMLFQTIRGNGPSETGHNFNIFKNSNKTISVHYKGSTDVEMNITSTNTVEKLNWYHIAVVRHNGYLKLFINGNLEATSSNSDNHDIKYVNYQGIDNRFQFATTDFYPIGTFDGCLNEFRYSKGIARWTVSFTPPTVSYNVPPEAPCDNMTLQSNAYEANDVPASARIVIFEEDALLSENPNVYEIVLVNTDIKAYISRDGGTTFTQVTLARELDLFNVNEIARRLGRPVNIMNLLVGTADLSAQPSGKLIVWKITTHNSKQLRLSAVALNWK
jgi:hypothetical protein